MQKAKREKKKSIQKEGVAEVGDPINLIDGYSMRGKWPSLGPTNLNCNSVRNDP